MEGGGRGRVRRDDCKQQNESAAHLQMPCGRGAAPAHAAGLGERRSPEPLQAPAELRRHAAEQRRARIRGLVAARRAFLGELLNKPLGERVLRNM